MRVLLINPASPYLYDDHALPPLGLLYLGAALEANGIDVDIADLSLPDSTIDGYNPDMIGITVVTANYPAVKKLITECRLAYPDVPIVAGGAHIGARYRDYLKLGADYGVVGYGEDALITYCLPPTPSIPLSKRGISFHPDRYPIPARHLVDMNQYSYKLDGLPATSLITARGCPYTCAFCAHYPGYTTYMPRSIDNVVKELDYLTELEYRRLIFYDDEFNLQNQRLLDLCREIEPYRIKFRCMVRSNLFTDQQAEALARAGCRDISVGVESGSYKILKAINKQETPAHNSEARTIAKAHGILFKAFIIVGLPGEDRQTLEETKRWLINNRVDDLAVSQFMPYPGSPIAENPDRYDIQINMDYERYSLAFRGSADAKLATVSRTSALSAEELAEARDRLETEVREELGLPKQVVREDRKWQA